MKPISPTYSLFFDELESKRQEINSLLDQYDEAQDSQVKYSIFVYLQQKYFKLSYFKEDVLNLEKRHNVKISTEQDFKFLKSLQSDLLADIQRMSAELDAYIFLLGE